MRAEVLVAEIGSTTTVVNAFSGPALLGQGIASTTVVQGDVTAGLRAAVADLEENLRRGGCLADGQPLEWDEMMACSSAAGGLKMTVHGLVFDMTVKAAREAALGAGAVIRLVTAGRLGPADLDAIRRIAPNLILLAGGVDYGEKATVIDNARLLASSGITAPVIYAGNAAARDEVSEALVQAGLEVTIVDNVYPRLDDLRIEPARRAIQAAFERHIIRAPGMESVRSMVTGSILPTPGAVMNAAQLLYGEIGDLVVLDVGGATTDVHSVTPGSEEIAAILSAPEPLAKRTVEGDLGVFVNAGNVAEQIGWDALGRELGLDSRRILAGLGPIPSTPEEIRLVDRLTAECVQTAVSRHAGRLRRLYGPSGRITVAEGKDLSRVRWIIGTGGALTRLPGGPAILNGVKNGVKSGADSRELRPPPEARVLIDRKYIMAVCGVLSASRPAAALGLLLESLGLTEAA